MPLAAPLPPGHEVPPSAALPREVPASAVAWCAVLAGAVGAAGLSLILFFLGSGLGLGAASPWLRGSMDASGWAMSAIAWLAFTQLAASALGGYLTGRLRVRWPGTPGDEVYFRDTAHGFLSWSVATLLTAALMVTIVGSAVNTGIQAGAVTAAQVGSAPTERAAPGQHPGQNDSMAPAPTQQQDTEAVTPEAAEKARKASTHAALWFCIALLAGALIASWTATVGGRQRDA